MDRTTIARTATITTEGTAGGRPGRGGRPSAADAAALTGRIIAAATELLLRDGYAATSVEAIASRAGVSKRTFYARFPDKPAAFLAVVRGLIRTWRDEHRDAIGAEGPAEEALLALARAILDVALTPTALALHVLVTAEAARFPEVGQALRAAGAETGTEHIAALLRRHDPALTPEAAACAAEQFQGALVHGPQRRALSGAAPSGPERDAWCRAAVSMLLRGVGRPT